MFERILFVCVGNICRSPMAMALLKKRLAAKSTSYQIHSAGLAALVGKPAASIVKSLLAAREVDISQHKGRQIDEQMVINADLILTMESSHKKQIERLFPFARGKVFLLGNWSDFEIPDPYGGEVDDYAKALQLIEKGLDEWQEKVCNN